MLSCGLLKHLGLRFWHVLEIGCTLLGSSLHFWFTEISVIENSEPRDGERKKQLFLVVHSCVKAKFLFTQWSAVNYI